MTTNPLVEAAQASGTSVTRVVVRHLFVSVTSVLLGAAVAVTVLASFKLGDRRTLH